MKKRSITTICLSTVILILLSFFLLKDVVLWQGVYTDHADLDRATNMAIKSLVLDAVKDRCSSLYTVNGDDIYDPSLRRMISNTGSATQKNVVCCIDRSFMQSVTKTDENAYFCIVKVYFPQELYYHIAVREMGDRFVITSFETDI